LLERISFWSSSGDRCVCRLKKVCFLNPSCTIRICPGGYSCVKANATPLRQSHPSSELYFLNDLATPRAQSMKRCATGLSVRFFKAMIPIGRRAVAKSTGKIFGVSFLLANANTLTGRMERNLPLATRLQRAEVEEVMIVACR